VAALVVGATAWVVIRRGVGDDSRGAGPPFVTAPVQRRSLRDVVVLRGTLRGRPLPALVATGAGRVTAVRVAPGSVVRAGDRVFDVEASPVVAVAGAFPYWRNLERGLVGPDVRQLEQLLAASGFSPGVVDDRFTGATGAAVRGWQQRHGLPVDGVFRCDRVLVAPWPVRVTSVGVAVGRSITPDQELLGISTIERVADLRASPVHRSALRIGQPVTLTTSSPGEGGGGVGLPGSIVAVATAPVAPAGGGEPTYPVTVRLARGSLATADRWPDGTALRGDVLVAEAPQALVVPVVAVRSDRGGRPAVEAVAGRRRRLVPVGLGLQEGGYVEVRSGLRVGQRVVLRLS
jgi:peptidoglycan hydrolase-like protein with peptidoglycan-binding domain